MPTCLGRCVKRAGCTFRSRPTVAIRTTCGVPTAPAPRTFRLAFMRLGNEMIKIALLIFFALAGTAAAQNAPRPNIVWISNEDMSPHLGVYGDTLARTPVLDRLARESIRYTRAFTTAPVCAPSRAAIITGMYQTTIGAQHMRTTEDRVPELPGPYLAVPPFYVKAFPEYLRAAGYFTRDRKSVV